jgi:hypothetical protein
MFYMQDSGQMLNVTKTWEIWGSESSVYENLCLLEFELWQLVNGYYLFEVVCCHQLQNLCSHARKRVYFEGIFKKLDKHSDTKNFILM